jgi:hypothetical protein
VRTIRWPVLSKAVCDRSDVFRTTSLEEQPDHWQILIVRANEQAPAVFQAALSEDTYVVR